jgi:fumarylacetoacetase
MKSWVHIPKDSDFSIHNLPFGIFSSKGQSPTVGVALGNSIIDLKKLADLGAF